MVCFPGLVNTSPAAGEGSVSQSLLAGVEMHPSLLQPGQHPSDMSLQGLNNDPEHTSAIQTNSYNDISGLSHPLYDPPPAYAAETSPLIPMNTAQSQNPVSHSRGAPPPYHGHHAVLPQQVANTFYPLEHASNPLLSDNLSAHLKREIISPSTPNLSIDVPLPRPAICRTAHHPTVACRKCNSVRSSNRHNAAILVRRANSSVGHGYRKSATMSACQVEVDTDDTPSILARLRKEWEMGNIPSFESTTNEVESPSHTISKNRPAEFKDEKESAADVKEYSTCQEQQGSSANVKGKPTQSSDFKDDQPPEYQKQEASPSHPRDKLTKGKSLQQDPAPSMGHTGQEGTLVQSKSLPSSDTSAPPLASLTAKLNLSNRIQNLFTSPSQGSACSVQTTDNKNSDRDYLNNKVNEERVSKKNDINYFNNNQENKTELIILEDADKLKTSKDITKPLQDVI